MFALFLITAAVALLPAACAVWVTWLAVSK